MLKRPKDSCRMTKKNKKNKSKMQVLKLKWESLEGKKLVQRVITNRQLSHQLLQGLLKKPLGTAKLISH